MKDPLPIAIVSLAISVAVLVFVITKSLIKWGVLPI